MEFPHLERLSRAECRQLLPGATVGRLAVKTPHFPTLEPVSFVVVEGELVVAARPGSAGEALAVDTRVAFEADVLDHAGRRGWSVVVSGRVEELDDDVAAIVRPQLKPWPVAEGDRLLLVRSEQISGQRVVATPAEPAQAAVAPIAASSPSGRLARRSLNTDESLRMLERGGQQVGRLVVSLPDGPAVFPLNFTVDDDAILFRTQVGTKLSAITRSLVTFEVDDVDASGRGWTVNFQGLAQEVLEGDPVAVDTWPGGDRPHVVRITPFRVYGTAWTAAETSTTASGSQSVQRQVWPLHQ